MARILVIDDEAGMRQVIAKVLVPHGHTMLTAEDGAQGVAICREEDPDVILADIRLPDMDAADLLSNLKSIKPTAPVIILSGFGDVEAAVELVRKGAFDYISKPFKVDSMLELVTKALKNPVKPVPPPERPQPKPVAPKPVSPVPAIPQPQPSAENAAPAPSLPKVKVVPARPVGGGSSGADAGLVRVSGRGSRGKKFWVSLVAAVLVLSAGGFGVYWKLVLSLPEDAVFAVSYANPTAICSDEKNIWVSDWAEQTVYKHAHDDNFTLMASFKLADIEPNGLAYDGSNFWVAHTMEQKIHKCSVGSVGLSVAQSYESPGPSPSGLCFDGTNLWSLDFQTAKVYRHRMDPTLSVAASFDSPAANPSAIFRMGKFFFIADAKTNRIFKVSIEDFALAGIYVLPGFEEQKRRLTGLAWDGVSLWACEDGVQKIYRFSMKDLQRAKL